tara:strand:- start:500 stop:766 length:267 start_codon:yes stop_codon:yes gene_type:complete
MKTEEQEETQAEKVYTKIELETMRKETLEYYKGKKSVLTAQLENEVLLADIEEAQLRQLVAITRKMQLVTPQTQADPEPERPLKKPTT